MIKQLATVMIIAVATLGVTGIASAQSGNAATASQDVRALVKTLRQKAVQLRSIHSETLKANPELREQQKQFVALLRDAIEDQGYDIDAGRTHVKQMTEKLKSGSLTDDERQTVMQDMTTERQSLNKARTAALQQPEIQTAGKKLQKATLTAMKKQNPNVEQLIQDMKDVRQQLRAAASSAGG